MPVRHLFTAAQLSNGINNNNIARDHDGGRTLEQKRETLAQSRKTIA
jgi:hypothetical protein